MNIKESLIKMDQDTDCMYDLTNMYESLKLDEEKKDELVKYINAYDIDATNKLLSTNFNANMSEALDDDDVSDMIGFNNDDKVDLHFDNVKYTKFSGSDPYESSAEITEFEGELPVDKDTVEEELIDIMTPEDFPEGMYERGDDEEMYNYIDNNLDTLLDKYNDTLTNIDRIKDKAEEYAQEEFGYLNEAKEDYADKAIKDLEDKCSQKIKIFQNRINNNKDKSKGDLENEFMDEMDNEGFTVDEQVKVIGSLDFDESPVEVMSKEMFESIDDEPYEEENLPKLEDIVKDSIVVYTDDIESITGEDVAKQFQLDDDDDLVEDIEEETTVDKFLVDENSVKKVVENLLNMPIMIPNTKKNKKFKDDYNLTEENVKSILKQITEDDYAYSKISKNIYFLGNILTVFLTKRDFGVSDKSLEDVVLYIKIDNSSEGYVTAISVHESERPQEFDDIAIIKVINDVYKEKGEIESDEAVMEIEDKLKENNISVDADQLGEMIVKSREMIDAGIGVDLDESVASQIDGLAKRYDHKDGYESVKDILFNIAGSGGNEVISKVAGSYMIESTPVKESIEDATIEDVNDFIKETKERFPGSEAIYDGDTNTIKITLHKELEECNKKLEESLVDKVDSLAKRGKFTEIRKLVAELKDEMEEEKDFMDDVDKAYYKDVIDHAEALINENSFDESFIHTQEETDEKVKYNPLVKTTSLEVDQMVYDSDNGHKLKVKEIIPDRYSYKVTFEDLNTGEEVVLNPGINYMFELVVDGDKEYEVMDEDIKGSAYISGDLGIEIYEVNDDEVTWAYTNDKENKTTSEIKYAYFDEDGNELEEARAYIDTDNDIVYLDEVIRND